MKRQWEFGMHGIEMRAKVTGIVVATALLGVALTPAALADSEPNGAVFMPEGPIVGGQDVTGTVGPGDEDDWYVFHVDGVQQLHLTSPQLPQSAGPGQGTTFSSCASVELTDANGSRIPPDFTSGPGESTFHVHVFQPEFQSCPFPASYSFRVDPAAALVSGPGKLPVKGTAEPNDTRSTAGGPLAPGAWYYSTLETANDEDWLRLYVRPRAGRVDVQTVIYGKRCDYHQVTLRSARGRELASVRATRETVVHLTHRTRRPARLYVQIANGPLPSLQFACVGSPTVVRVAPDDAIMSAAEVKRACAEGRSSTRRGKRRVAAGKRAIARAEARGAATGRLRAKLKRDRSALRKSSAAASAYCSR
jgi:hypothetical protein